MRRLAFINEKGGTCKTTLAVSVAAWLATERKARVLLVDLDTQGHAGKSLGLDVRALEPNAFDWLTDARIALRDVARPTSVEGVTLVPSYKQMGRLPEVLAGKGDRARRLDGRMAEAEAAGYDVVVMDAPPSMGLTTVNILVAAREVVVPVALTYLSLDGCAEVVDTVERVVAEHGCGALRITRVVPTLYRKTALADEILERLSTHFPGRVTEPLGFNVKIDEAQSHGQTIWQYAPWSRGAQLLSAIAADVDAAGR